MSTSEPSRTSRRWVVAAIAATAVVALVAGIWFAAFSPKASTVMLEATQSAVVGEPATLSGIVTPARSDRVVRMAFGQSENGPWLPGPEAATDSAGRFAQSHVPTEAGEVWLRATAVPLGRDQEATSTPVKLMVRVVTALSLTSSADVARTDKSMSLSGVLTPAGGTLKLEKSSDGASWAPENAIPVVADDGAFKFTLKNVPAGSWQFRAAAAETPVATSATSKPVNVVVEDFKAAGEKYLALIAPVNKTIVATNAAGDAYDGSAASLKALKNAAGRQSEALSKAAKELRAYPGWPREIAATVESFAKHAVVEADGYSLMSKASTLEEFDIYLSEIRDEQSAAYAEVAAIREALGLPKRSPVP